MSNADLAMDAGERGRPLNILWALGPTWDARTRLKVKGEGERGFLWAHRNLPGGGRNREVGEGVFRPSPAGD